VGGSICSAKVDSFSFQNGICGIREAALPEEKKNSSLIEI